MNLSPKYTNQLINETSPYLLQHAHNPVDWHPWSSEILLKAQREDKLVLVSIGYAACHWCHVMERESFENEEVADIMNRHFICIKVDREERPDIDHVYMDAVQMLTGRGGWPLNCFTLPDGRPFFGGTYFPKANWIQILKLIHQTYQNEKGKVLEQVIAITENYENYNHLITSKPPDDFSASWLKNYYDFLSRSFDKKHGGSKGAPKFPMPGISEFLLNYHHSMVDPEALHHTEITLMAMAQGGIYDQLGGGFARYSTDEQWFAPHFEKMLYDNAQLISVYCKAFLLTHSPTFQRIIQETMNFVKKQLTSPKGGFYASMDADSEGVEGKYYIWDKVELESILGPDTSYFCNYYHITEAGNWEHHKNILYTDIPLEILPATEKKIIIRCKEKLLKQRSQRIPPALDSKILCSWNALMLTACLDAFLALDDPEYLEMAKRNAAYLEDNHLQKNGKINRSKQGNKIVQGFLDDYSLTALAFISMYQVTTAEKWLEYAHGIIKYAIQHFRDADTGMFFYTSNEDIPLATRKIELQDHVIPASNSVMAKVLYLSGRILDIQEYIDMAKEMLLTIQPAMIQYPWYHANWAELVTRMAFPPVELIITGPDSQEAIQKVAKHFLPHVLVCGSKKDSNLPLLKNRFKEGQNLFYVCIGNVCQLPVNTMEEALSLIKSANS